MQRIGFSCKIRLEWLEKTAQLVLLGEDERDIRTKLDNFLKDKLSVGRYTPRGSREKTISILRKIWVTPPKHLRRLHEDGLKLLKKMPPEERIAIHWGMSIAVYPFFGSVALQTGRLLKLQETVSPSQIFRRIKEQYGDRETVLHATKKVLESFVDWRVLRRTNPRGIYTSGLFQEISFPEVIIWMIEAYLYSQNSSSLEFKTIINSPVFFPFKFTGIQEILTRQFSRVEIVTHSADQYLVHLIKNAQF